MSLEVIRTYATSHICQDNEQYTNDIIYQILTEELSPLSLTHYPETTPIDPDEPVELIPKILHLLREKIDMKDGEKWDEVWDVPRKAVDLIVRIQRGLKRLKKVDGKLTGLGVGLDPFVRSVSPPPSPVLSKRALRETPKVGHFANSNSRDLLGRPTKTFLRALHPIELDHEFGIETLKLDPEDTLDTKLSLSEKTAEHVRSLLSSLPEIPRNGKRNLERNPILESAKDRARTLEVVMNPVWARERDDQLIYEKESTCCMSPPIFSRRLDSVCHASRDKVDGSTTLPTTLGQIGNCLTSISGSTGLSPQQALDKIIEDPFSMESLDEFMHIPPIPSDITFSPPSSDPELGASFIWPINISMEPHITADGEADDFIEPPIFSKASELRTHRDHDRKKWPRTLSEVLANMRDQQDETYLRDEFSSTPTPHSRTINKLKLDFSEFGQGIQAISSAVSPSLAGQASPTEKPYSPTNHNDLFMLNSDDLVHELLGLLHKGDVSPFVGSSSGWLEEFDPEIGQGHDILPNPSLRPAKDCVPADLPSTPSSLKDVVRFLSLMPPESLAKPLEVVRLSGLTSLSVQLSWRPLSNTLKDDEVINLNDLYCEEDHAGRQTLIDSVESLFVDPLHQDARVKLYHPGPLYLPQELDGFIYTRKEAEIQESNTSDSPCQTSEHGAERVAEPTLSFDQTTPLRHDKRPRLTGSDKILVTDVVENYTTPQPLRFVNSLVSSTLSRANSIEPEGQAGETRSSSLTSYELANPKNIPSDDEVDDENLDLLSIPELLVDSQRSEPLSHLSPLSHFLSTRKKHFNNPELASTCPLLKRSEKSNGHLPSEQIRLESTPEEIIKTPQNLTEFEGFSTGQAVRMFDGEEIWYHCIGGQKLLQNRRAYRSLENSFVLPHYRSHPTLSREANPSISIGLDLILTTLTAAAIYPLQILPSILSQIPKLVEQLQSRYDNLYIILTIPADRETEVWTSLVKSSIGKARRAVAMQGLNPNTEEGLEVRIGWVREDDLGDLLRSLLDLSSTSPTKMGCLGDNWLAPWEHTNDRDEASWEEMESSLASFNRMNPFSAAWILALMNLDEYLDMDPLERINTFGPLFGFHRMERQSEFITSRRLILPSEKSTPSLPPSSPPSLYNIPFVDQYTSGKRMVGHLRPSLYWQDSSLEEMSDILEEGEY